MNNSQIDNEKYINVVMPVYSFIEYSDKYSKKSEILWHYYRYETLLNANGAIANFPADNNNSALVKFKTKIAAE